MFQSGWFLTSLPETENDPSDMLHLIVGALFAFIALVLAHHLAIGTDYTLQGKSPLTLKAPAASSKDLSAEERAAALKRAVFDWQGARALDDAGEKGACGRQHD